MAQSDGELLALLATNLDRYFKQLVLNYQQRLYTFVLRQTGSLQDAEDIVQEAFIRAYYALADYPAERIQTLKLQAWLFEERHSDDFFIRMLLVHCHRKMAARLDAYVYGGVRVPVLAAFSFYDRR